MPVAFIFVGIYLAAVVIRGTQNEFFQELKSDFWGKGSFMPFLASLAFLWFVGFIPSFKPVSQGLMILVLIVLFLKRGTGFFDQLNKQLGIT